MRVAVLFRVGMFNAQRRPGSPERYPDGVILFVTDDTNKLHVPVADVELPERPGSIVKALIPKPDQSKEGFMHDKQAFHYLGLLDRALRFARKNLSPDITAQRLLILIAVYFHEGLSQRELMRHLESTSITALSRNLADLSALTTRKLPGPGLLELRTDPLNLRVKRVYLTPKGRRFVKRWLAETAA